MCETFGEQERSGRETRGRGRLGSPSKEAEDTEGSGRKEGAGRTPWPAIRPAGGRWSGADNGAEECGTWD